MRWRERQRSRGTFFALLIFTGCVSSMINRTSRSLRVDFSAPAEVRLGDSAMLRLSLHNETGRDIPLSLNGDGGWAFDPLVRRPDGAVIWERLAHVVMAGRASHPVMHPGDSLAFEARWPLVDNSGHRVSAGTYTVIPMLMDAYGEPIIGERHGRQIRVLEP